MIHRHIPASFRHISDSAHARTRGGGLMSPGFPRIIRLARPDGEGLIPS